MIMQYTLKYADNLQQKIVCSLNSIIMRTFINPQLIKNFSALFEFLQITLDTTHTNIHNKSRGSTSEKAKPNL